MVKILRYKVPYNCFNNRFSRPQGLQKMEEDLNNWSADGWRIVSVQTDASSDEILVFLEK